MNKELKDTVEVLAANGGALGITFTQCNEFLQFIHCLIELNLF